ncbi:MAG: hypothetical protein ACT4QC_14150 [Planctomycetaceae bacterium]
MIGRGNSWQALALVVTLAIAARGLALWRFGDTLQSDPDAYRVVAKSIVAGNGFGFADDFSFGSPTAYRPPLYPCLLALLAWVCGGDMALASQAAGLAQLALGIATVWLTVLCARRLGLGHFSLLAGLLVAVDPLLAYCTAAIMTETLAAFLSILLVWSWMRANSPAGLFATGFLFGLACLCRPTYWVVGVVVAGGWLAGWCARRMRGARPDPGRLLREPFGGGAVPWKQALTLVTGIGLAVAPWVVRNALVMGEPILTTTHGGYTLLLAHNPVYTRDVVEGSWGAVWKGPSLARWHQSLEEVLGRESPPLDLAHKSPAVELARDRWMSRTAWQYVRGEPVIALRAGLSLLGRFWNVVPLSTETRTLPRALVRGLAAFYLAVFVAMLAGLVRLRRYEWLPWWPLVALLVGFTAVHALYWADMRMRAPLVPAIALLAARGVRWNSYGDKKGD